MFENLSLHEAFQKIKQMIRPDLNLSVSNLYNLIQICFNEKNICAGRKVHVLIVKCGYESNSFLASHMIRLFALCGSLVEANQVFVKVQNPDVFTWNALIAGHAQLGNDEQALSFYNHLNICGFNLDAHVFVAALKACHSLEHILLIHTQLIEDGLYGGIYIPVTLLSIYTKYGNIEELLSIFNRLQEKPVVAWNVLIKGFNHQGHTDHAFQSFLQMQTEGIFATHVTFVTVLKTCSYAETLRHGKFCHCQVLTCELNANMTVDNTLIDMYAKCASLDDAYRVFRSCPSPGVVTWNAMIAGYVQHGHFPEALGIFQEMQTAGVKANQVTFSTIVKACCSHTIYLHQGMLLHGIIIENGLELNSFISSALISMYAKWGSVDDGRDVFFKLQNPNIVAWSAIISSNAQNNLGKEAIDAFEKMQLEGFQPNQILYASVLKACSDLALLDFGKLIHAQIIERDLIFNVFIASTLIDMYTKCNSFCDARNVFNRYSKRNVVTWSAMIAGHAGFDRTAEALSLFSGMHDDGVDPNQVTFIALLSLCASIDAVDQGMLIHAQIMEMRLETVAALCNSLVDMYANCGALYDACKVLERSEEKDVVTWNALIAGCTKYSDCEAALICLKAMLRQNVSPNDITFVSILSLCNHVGLVDEAVFHLSSMMIEYEILPSYEHYMCTIDLVGRAGFFDEAEDIVNTMPVCPDFVALASLLNHCKTYKNRELARLYFDGIVSFDSRNALSSVNMADIYDSEVSKDVSYFLEGLRNNANAWKTPGMACLELENENTGLLLATSPVERLECVQS